jgi:DNA recombination protein RmuC
MESLLVGLSGLGLGLIGGFLVARGRARPRVPADFGFHTELVRNDLAVVRESLGRLGDLVQRNGGEGKSGFAELSTVLRNVDARTNTMASALGNSRVRGQWGERAAEDILRSAGFVEGVSYFKQQPLDGGRTRPDFTFPLPKGYTLNMDVKFPIENYARLVEATVDADRDRFERAFLRDVRGRVKEVVDGSYADPARGTVDYALLFIPSESVYAEINRLDVTFVDAALSQRVIPCSPLTLFGVLAVVRKAAESFAFNQASNEVLVAMDHFESEWRRFIDNFAVLGRQLATARGTYDQLVGVRATKLEAPLAQIAALRRERGLPALASDIDPSANGPNHSLVAADVEPPGGMEVPFGGQDVPAGDPQGEAESHWRDDTGPASRRMLDARRAASSRDRSGDDPPDGPRKQERQYVRASDVVDHAQD